MSRRQKAKNNFKNFTGDVKSFFSHKGGSRPGTPSNQPATGFVSGSVGEEADRSEASEEILLLANQDVEAPKNTIKVPAGDNHPRQPSQATVPIDAGEGLPNPVKPSPGVVDTGPQASDSNPVHLMDQPITESTVAEVNDTATPANDDTKKAQSVENTPTQPPQETANSASTKWKGLKELSRVLEPTANLFGPLKEVVTMFIGCMAEAARAEYDEVQVQLEGLLQDLAMYFSQSGSLTMTKSMESICGSMREELKMVQEKLGRNPGVRYLEAPDEMEAIVSCYRRIKVHMRRLTLNANMEMWKVVEEHAAESHSDRVASRVDRLSAAPPAWYDSAEGIELKRRPCTAGTRADVLASILAWACSAGGGAVYWMNGMAGTGKTTIAYSVCADLDARHQLGASFFCSRLREECRNVNIIIPSIAYQLARFSRPFQSALSKVLEKDPDVHRRRPDMQFDALIAKPTLEARDALPEGLAVVIDALDECEHKETTSQMLDVLLSKSASLPIKFIVSSRPETQIRDQMTDDRAKSRLVLHELDKGEVQLDIEKYLREGLAEMNPSDAQIAALVERAGILFIYAATAVRYISHDNFRRNPASRLRTILSASHTKGGAKNEEIDQLYTTILGAALGDRSLETSEREDMQQVLYTVICAREPLKVKSLSALLRIDDVECVRAALRPLWSVLHVVGTNEVVTTLHASFSDFMFDPARSLTYFCDSNAHHRTLADLCLEQIARTKPQVNICGLETPCPSDEEVPRLKERVTESISSELLYACRYWADHIKAAKCESCMDNQLGDFLSTRLLLWMEVLNLTNHMNAATACMKAIASWCQAYRAQEELLELAYDARRFVEAFAANPVSQSTPHIYASMLAFWPRSAPISKYYVRNTPMPVGAEGKALSRRQLAHISTWDFKWYIQAMAVSADGLYLAISIYTEVLLVDSTSGRMLFEPLQGHPKTVESLAFIPDKPWVLAGSFGDEDSHATILGWDTGTGNATLGPIQLRGHTDSIKCLRFSPDCSRIATGSADKTARLWDTDSGNMLHQLQAHGVVFTTVFSADGDQLIAGANKTLHRWDTRTGQPAHTPITHTEDSDMIAISPDQSRLISGSLLGRKIYVSNAITGDMIRSVEGHTEVIRCIMYSPDGRYIVSGSEAGTVRVWDAESGNLVLGPLEGHTNRINSIVFSPDGSRIISACIRGLVCTWDAQQRGLTSTSTDAPSDRIACVKFTPEGAHFVSGSEDGRICIRDAQTGEISLGPLELHTNRITTLDVKNRYVVSGSEDGRVCVWDAESGEVVLGPLQVGSGAIQAIAYSPDGELIATVSDGGVNVWNAQDGNRMLGPLTGLLDTVFWVRSVSYSPNGALIASGSYDCTIILWDAYTGKKAMDPLTRHSNRVLSVSFSPDSTRLVSGSADKTIRIWDVRTGETMFELLHGHEGWITSVEYSPDGTRIMSCSWDKSVRIHDARSPEERAQSRSESDVGDWRIRKDGWVVDDQSRLLVWVPGDLRKSLMPSITRATVTPQGYVGLKFDKTRMGEAWAESYASQM